MPRPPRIQDAGFVHHVVTRGNDRQILFRDDEDFSIYCSLIENARKIYPINIFNYVLMDNHIHLLVEPLEDGSLSKVMENVSKGYAKFFNKKYGRIGHVFQGRFKSFLIQEERYFFACSRYIDLNPVKAGLAIKPDEYEWSAYRFLGYGKETQIKMNYHNIYKDLGVNKDERQIVYRAMVANYHGIELDLLNKRAGILGDKEFVKYLKKKYERKIVQK